MSDVNIGDSAPTAKSNLKTRALTLSLSKLTLKLQQKPSREEIERGQMAQIEQMSTTKKSILKLHNLIKKQTILVCIAVGSTTGLAVVSTLDAAGIAVCGWDTVVNALCAWLMLNVSRNYWICCSQYGLCRCCYLTDEQNQMMILLERSRSMSNLSRSPTATQMSSVP